LDISVEQHQFSMPQINDQQFPVGCTKFDFSPMGIAFASGKQ
jgi:hypothetical protein